ncbi:MAG: ABC transporter ATP-binding protein [Acidobacteriota bacterium]|nr:ABC transporter ATP-binding protein [Acidobacteriota bacterium]
MPEGSLAVEQVSVFYGPNHARTAAVNEVSLRFEPGTLTLIMGPSGSGKTTLLSVLGALLRPDSGKVYLNGAEVGGFSEDERTRLRREQIGFVFQAFRLLHALTALDNVLIAKDVRGGRAKEDREAATKVLFDLGLGSKLNLKPKELSGGEKQRVAIARALLGSPKILLADEPTASLDSHSGMQICELLRKLSDERRYTTVVVSHDPRWIGYVDRVVVLEDGRVIEKRENKR